MCFLYQVLVKCLLKPLQPPVQGMGVRATATQTWMMEIVSFDSNVFKLIFTVQLHVAAIPYNQSMRNKT